MARLIHLNGMPGIGKSTLAHRYADEHPGVLACDVDVLRTLIGGWEQDFGRAGALIRPAALALIGAYLGQGQDVVLPQLLARLSELERFEQAAIDASADFVELMLVDDGDDPVARFHRRGAEQQPSPWHDQARAIVEAEGGDEALQHWRRALEEILRRRPGARVIRSAENRVDETYAALLRALDEPISTR